MICCRQTKKQVMNERRHESKEMHLKVIIRFKEFQQFKETLFKIQI